MILLFDLGGTDVVGKLEILSRIGLWCEGRSFILHMSIKCCGSVLLLEMCPVLKSFKPFSIGVPGVSLVVLSRYSVYVDVLRPSFFHLGQ